MSAIHRTKEWAKFTRTARPVIEATLPAPCVECGGPVMPGSRWHVSHIVSHMRDPFQPLDLEHVGPGHWRCNITAGAKEGRAKQLRAKAEGQRLPSEDSGW